MLHASIPPERELTIEATTRVPALLLLLLGLMKLALPLFPVYAAGAPATSAGRVHQVLGNLTFLLFPLAALLLFRALRRMGSRLAPGIAVVLAIATVGVLVGNAVGVFGFAQRAYLVLCAVWVLSAAVAVIHNLRAGTLTSPAPRWLPAPGRREALQG